MNYFNHAVLFFAAAVSAQDYTSQYADQISSASAVISQDAQAIQATVSSYVQAHNISTQVPESVKANVSERHDKRKDKRDTSERHGKREAAVASASAYFVDQGYSSMPPAEARHSYISSLMVAQSTQISDMRVSASAFLATQTNINTASVAAAVSSYAATATTKPKRKGRMHRRKEKKSKKDAIQATSTATTTGLSNGFKNFFKSLQLKIQKTKTVSVSAASSEPAPAPTSTSM